MEPTRKQDRVTQLFRMFPEHMPLHQYLSSIIPGGKDALIPENDPHDYIEFVTTAIVGFPPGMGTGAKEFKSFRMDSTQSEIVNRVIERLFKQPKPSHVLCFGYRQMRSHSTHGIRGIRGVENYYPNTLVTYVKSKMWDRLLARVGDDVMIHLLQHLAVFAALRNNCFLQVSGPPAMDLLAHMDTANRQHTQPIQPHEKPTEVSSTQPQNAPQTTDANGVEVGQPPASPEFTTQSKQPERAEPANEIDPPTKKRRMSSWLRRKLKRQKTKPYNDNEGSEVVQMETDQSTHVNSGEQNKQKGLHETQPIQPTHPNNSKTGIPVKGTTNNTPQKPGFHPPTHAANGEETSRFQNAAISDAPNNNTEMPPETQPAGEGVTGLADGGIVGAEDGAGGAISLDGGVSNGMSQILIPRTKIFYSHSFRTRLPRQHPLVALKPCRASARVLACSIFDPPVTTKEPKPAANQMPGAPYETQPQAPPPRHIPKRVGPVVGPIQQVLESFKKCPIRRLLNKHCPIRLTAEQVQAGGSSNTQYGKVTDWLSHEWEHQSQASMDDGSQSGTEILEQDDDMIGCSAPSGEQGSKTNNSTRRKTCAELVEHVSPHRNGTCFLHAVLSDVIPASLWGSDHNKRICFDNVGLFVRLRRYETVSLHQLMHRFRVKDCTWAYASDPPKGHRPPNDQSKATEMVATFLKWLFTDLVIPLIQTYFYVTESAQHRYHTLYYRKAVWRAITTESFELTATTMLEHLTEAEAAQCLRSSTLGYSYLRYLPKVGGVRPIINMARKQAMSIPKSGSFKGAVSINTRLTNAFHVLTSVQDAKHKEQPRASVLCLTDIYKKMGGFIKSWKDTAKPRKPVYFVGMDIRKAFDTINQDRLLSIMSRLIDEDEYMVRRFVAITSSQGRLRREFKRHAASADSFNRFPDFASDVLTEQLNHAIIVDQVVYQYQEKDQLLELVSEHVAQNLLKIGAGFYRQKEGISQGSVLSTLLCSFFMEDLEENCLLKVAMNQGVLLRFVDDFLLLTTELTLARRFLDTMLEGFPEYGARVNADKTVIANFSHKWNGNPIHSLPESDFFPWCGLLLCPKTLDIRADHTRYADTWMRDSLTVNYHSHQGQAIVNKLMQFMRFKCHPLLMDCSLNSVFGVGVNIHQLCMLAAVKLCAYLHELKIGGTTSTSLLFVAGAIHRALGYMFELIQARINSPIGQSQGAKFSFTRNDITWLGAHAFHRVFSRKQTMYKGLLKILDETMKGAESPSRRGLMAKIVDPSLSDALDKIHY